MKIIKKIFLRFLAAIACGLWYAFFGSILGYATGFIILIIIIPLPFVLSFFYEPDIAFIQSLPNIIPTWSTVIGNLIGMCIGIIAGFRYGFNSLFLDF